MNCILKQVIKLLGGNRAVGSEQGPLLSLAIRVPTKEPTLAYDLLVDECLLGQEGYENGVELHVRRRFFCG